MPERTKMALVRHLPLVGVVALIVWGAIVPVPEPHLMADQDKANHFLAFLAFAVTLRFAQPRLHAGWVMAWAVAFGSGIEFMQACIPGRDASFWDVVADTVGSFAGCWVPAWTWAWMYRWLP